MKSRTQRTFLNYFRKWEGAAMLGLIVLAVGLLMLWIGRGSFAFLLAIGFIPVGLAIFLYGSIGRASEADLRNEIARRAEKIRFPEVETDSHFHRRVPKEPEILSFEGWQMREGLLFHRLKNGSFCSSAYIVARVMVLTDAFYAKTLRFSFIDDETAEETVELPFADLTDITVERGTFSGTMGKVNIHAKTCFLVMTSTDGKRLEFPAPDDVYTDEFAEKLKARVKGD